MMGRYEMVNKLRCRDAQRSWGSASPIVVLAALAVLSLVRPLAASAPRYANPGWLHVLQGDSAFYNDPDGPNPDYINGTDANQPGGQQGTAALINPGLLPNGQVNNAVAPWLHRGTNWDGSAPGAPLGGPPSGVPPIPPAAPGGVGTFTQGGVTYLRIQDTGNPLAWGWADKGQQAGPGAPRQEGSNRRIQFAHPLDRDAGFSGGAAVLDNGITLTFRTRLATAATGPLDEIYREEGPAGGPPEAWPTQGVGYPVANNGRGMFMVTQTGPNGPGQLAFSLLNTGAFALGDIPTTKTGLVLNNRASSPTGGSVDTNSATTATLNIVELTDTQLTEWREFWITIRALPTPADGNTHEVNVWLDGALTPTTFQTILGNQNEFGTGAHLGLGLSSGTRWGAFDVDFFAYREGVVTPTLAAPVLAGDYNGDQRVDAADYTTWRDNLGATLTLTNETVTPGVVTIEDYDAWKNNFGAGAAAAAAASAAVPETPTMLLAVIGAMLAYLIRERRDGVLLPASLGH